MKFRYASAMKCLIQGITIAAMIEQCASSLQKMDPFCLKSVEFKDVACEEGKCESPSEEFKTKMREQVAEDNKRIEEFFNNQLKKFDSSHDDDAWPTTAKLGTLNVHTDPATTDENNALDAQTSEVNTVSTPLCDGTCEVETNKNESASTTSSMGEVGAKMNVSGSIELQTPMRSLPFNEGDSFKITSILPNAEITAHGKLSTSSLKASASSNYQSLGLQHSESATEIATIDMEDVSSVTMLSSNNEKAFARTDTANSLNYGTNSVSTRRRPTTASFSFLSSAATKKNAKQQTQLATTSFRLFSSVEQESHVVSREETKTLTSRTNTDTKESYSSFSSGESSGATIETPSSTHYLSANREGSYSSIYSGESSEATIESLSSTHYLNANMDSSYSSTYSGESSGATIETPSSTNILNSDTKGSYSSFYSGESSETTTEIPSTTNHDFEEASTDVNISHPGTTTNQADHSTDFTSRVASSHSINSEPINSLAVSTEEVHSRLASSSGRAATLSPNTSADIEGTESSHIPSKGSISTAADIAFPSPTTRHVSSVTEAARGDRDPNTVYYNDSAIVTDIGSTDAAIFSGTTPQGVQTDREVVDKSDETRSKTEATSPSAIGGSSRPHKMNGTFHTDSVDSSGISASPTSLKDISGISGDENSSTVTEKSAESRNVNLNLSLTTPSSRMMSRYVSSSSVTGSHPTVTEATGGILSTASAASHLDFNVSHSHMANVSRLSSSTLVVGHTERNTATKFASESVQVTSTNDGMRSPTLTDNKGVSVPSTPSDFKNSYSSVTHDINVTTARSSHSSNVEDSSTTFVNGRTSNTTTPIRTIPNMVNETSGTITSPSTLTTRIWETKIDTTISASISSGTENSNQETLSYNVTGPAPNLNSTSSHRHNETHIHRNATQSTWALVAAGSAKSEATALTDALTKPETVQSNPTFPSNTMENIVPEIYNSTLAITANSTTSDQETISVTNEALTTSGSIGDSSVSTTGDTTNNTRITHVSSVTETTGSEYTEIITADTGTIGANVTESSTQTLEASAVPGISAATTPNSSLQNTTLDNETDIPTTMSSSSFALTDTAGSAIVTTPITVTTGDTTNYNRISHTASVPETIGSEYTVTITADAETIEVNITESSMQALDASTVPGSGTATTSNSSLQNTTLDSETDIPSITSSSFFTMTDNTTGSAIVTTPITATNISANSASTIASSTSTAAESSSTTIVPSLGSSTAHEQNNVTLYHDETSPSATSTPSSTHEINTYTTTSAAVGITNKQETSSGASVSPTEFPGEIISHTTAFLTPTSSGDSMTTDGDPTSTSLHTFGETQQTFHSSALLSTVESPLISTVAAHESAVDANEISSTFGTNIEETEASNDHGGVSYPGSGYESHNEPNWIDGKNGYWYQFVDEAKSYRDAQAWCSRQTASLATCAFLNRNDSLEDDSTDLGFIWIGLDVIEEATFEWQWLGENISLNSQPFWINETTDMERCGAMMGNQSSSALLEMSCDTELPYICEKSAPAGDEWQIISNLSFKYFAGKKNFSQATASCTVFNSSLLVRAFSHMNTTTKFIDLVRPSGSADDIWIGLHSVKASNSTWKWTNSTLCNDSSVFWGKGWPHNENEMRCGGIFRSGARTIANKNCEEQHPFVCEKPAVTRKTIHITLTSEEISKEFETKIVYEFFGEAKTFSEAKEACQNRNSSLANADIVTNNHVNASSLLNQAPSQIWVGLEKEVSGSTGALWKWLDGTSWNASHAGWNGNGNAGNPAKDCGCISRGSLLVNNCQCNRELPYVCEKSVTSSNGSCSSLCVNSTMVAQCANDTKIQVFAAHYGYAENCGSVKCNGWNVTSTLSARCDDRDFCCLADLKGCFGEPCYGSRANLFVIYGCTGNNNIEESLAEDALDLYERLLTYIELTENATTMST